MSARIGRPVKPAVAGKKAALGLRVTPEIKAKLDASAKMSGRTQSQEAELRLEQSFRDEPIVAALARIELLLRCNAPVGWAADLPETLKSLTWRAPQ